MAGYISSLIERLVREKVEFDPYNKEHIQAYDSLRNDGRQTRLRFVLQYPFLDVVTMMEYKLAQRVVNDVCYPKEQQSASKDS